MGKERGNTCYGIPPQPVEKPPGVRGPQCSSQRSRCVGPWGLPGAPLLTGLPPRSSRHWRRSALPPRRLSSALAAQGELSRRDKRRPPGGCAANPQKALRSRGFPAWLPARAVGARATWKSRKGGVKPLFRQGVTAAYSAAFFLCKGRKKQPAAFGAPVAVPVGFVEPLWGPVGGVR